jgi:hypothetical protein
VVPLVYEEARCGLCGSRGLREGEDWKRRRGVGGVETGWFWFQFEGFLLSTFEEFGVSCLPLLLLAIAYS